jgi:hypothetical protein
MGHVWCCDARGVCVAACAATAQVLWRQGRRSGGPCRHVWAVSTGCGPEFTGTASADKFIGATQVKGKASRSSKCDATNIGLGEDDGQGMMCSHMNVPRWMSPLQSEPGLNVKASPANGTVEDVDLATFRPTYISEPKDRRRKRKTRNRRVPRVARFFLLMLTWMAESHCRSPLRIKTPRSG